MARPSRSVRSVTGGAPDIGSPSTDRTDILRALTARPASADLATLIAMADTDEVVRLRLLRAIRDLGV
jgi:hypothetical protein